MTSVRACARLAVVVLLFAFASAQAATDLSAPLRVRWSSGLAWRPVFKWRTVENAEPVVSDGLVYVGLNGGRAVFALSAQGGVVRWKYATEGRIETTPLLKDGTLFVGDSKGWLYAFESLQGGLRWKQNVGGVALGHLAADEQHVYVVTSDHRLHARDIVTGGARWSYRREVAGGITIYGVSSPVLVGETIIAGFSDGSVVALSKSAGVVAWQKELVDSGRFRDVDGSPLLQDGKLYLGTYRGKFFCLNATDGQILWTAEPGGVTGVAGAGDTIFHGTDDGEVVARQASDGQVLWTYRLPKGVATTPVVSGDTLWVGSSLRSLYALDSRSGAVRWEWEPSFRPSGFTAAPTISDGVLYALSNAGTLYSLVPDAAFRWRLGADADKVSQAGEVVQPPGKE